MATNCTNFLNPRHITTRYGRRGQEIYAMRGSQLASDHGVRQSDCRATKANQRFLAGEDMLQ